MESEKAFGKETTSGPHPELQNEKPPSDSYSDSMQKKPGSAQFLLPWSGYNNVHRGPEIYGGSSM